MTSPPKRTRKAKRKRTAQRVRILRDIDDVAGEVRAAICGSRTEAEDFVRQREAIVADGSRGSLRVWQNDDGWWRCQFTAGEATGRVEVQRVALATYQHPAAVVEWLKEWWPKLHQ